MRLVPLSVALLHDQMVSVVGRSPTFCIAAAG
jgi:hypothetical protein